MTSQILQSIQTEPPLHRWLHSRDPDRDLSKDILESSATYITHVPSSQSTCTQVPPTVSLFVPMYRRNQFILGQLYGPMSPNSMAIHLLASKGQTSPPCPISRRFVTDLSHDTINFIEYEWFADGKLCVSVHHVNLDGIYSGQSILLDDPKHLSGEIPPKHLTKNDLLFNSTPPPSKIIMTLNFSELTTCSKCYPSKSKCICKHSSSSTTTKSKRLYDSPTNWETWLNALQTTRSGFANIHMKLQHNPRSISHSSTNVFVDESCEIGIGQDSPTGAILARQFLSSIGMTTSHPGIDSIFRSMIEGKHRIEIQNRILIEEEDDEWNEKHSISTNQKVLIQPNEDSNARVPLIPIINGFADTVAPITGDVDGSSSSTQQDDTKMGKIVKNNGNKSPRKVVVEREQEGDGKNGLQKQKATRKKAKTKKKLSLVCDLCGHVFDHRGHYNEHQLGKHQGYKPHKCEFPGCQRYVFHILSKI